MARSQEEVHLEEASADVSPSSSSSSQSESRRTEVDPQPGAPSGRGDRFDPDAPVPAWQTLFAGSPREVLSRLVQDDPLGVRGRIARRLRADALLLDGDRVHLRTFARISRSAGSYRGRPDPTEWVAGLVAESVEEIVREMHEQARRRARSREDRARTGSPDPTKVADEAREADAFDVLAGPLGLDPGSMRTACAEFDVLPFADRTAFFDLVLESRDLDACARAAGVNASELARRARRGLDAILGSGVGFAPDPKPMPLASAAPPAPVVPVVQREPERAATRGSGKGRRT